MEQGPGHIATMMITESLLLSCHKASMGKGKVQASKGEGKSEARVR